MGDIANWLAGQIDVLNNIAKNLGPIQKLISGAAYLMGLAFAFKALYTESLWRGSHYDV